MKPCSDYESSLGHQMTNKPAGWVHGPYARGQGKCQHGDRLPGLPEFHPTDRLQLNWPGSKNCSACVQLVHALWNKPVGTRDQGNLQIADFISGLLSLRSVVNSQN